MKKKIPYDKGVHTKRLRIQEILDKNSGEQNKKLKIKDNKKK